MSDLLTPAEYVDLLVERARAEAATPGPCTSPDEHQPTGQEADRG